jgi:hypothetical protein
MQENPRGSGELGFRLRFDREIGNSLYLIRVIPAQEELCGFCQEIAGLRLGREMAKDKGKAMKGHFEQLPEDSASRGFGFLATIAVLTIVGVVLWVMLSRHETN